MKHMCTKNTKMLREVRLSHADVTMGIRTKEWEASYRKAYQVSTKQVKFGLGDSKSTKEGKLKQERKKQTKRPGRVTGNKLSPSSPTTEGMNQGFMEEIVWEDSDRGKRVGQVTAGLRQGGGRQESPWLGQKAGKGLQVEIQDTNGLSQVCPSLIFSFPSLSEEAELSDL